MNETPSRSRAWRRFRRSPSAWIGGVLVGVFVFAASAADLVAPYPPSGPDARSGGALARPSSSHWLGTDIDEWDVLSRTIYGGRLSLLAGLVS
ncbi:MAG: D,D-dipeptide ABC transporter permease, partial [Planctomycetes bacterium]|nr:D,D-dipeptide ABC transporter permease [Planctomycetota bacterium]